jgi:S1-C subfamily serine protease
VTPNGLVLTNKHVVGDPSASYTVVMNDDRKYPARILSRDPINDVAILKIDARGLPTVALGDATKLELGQTVIAIGNALGLFRNTVSSGIVSGLSRSISAESDGRTPTQELRGLIQTDAAINPGNSGGPLVDLAGRAVGVNVAVAFEAENIGFAIPINAARRDLADIKKYGRIRRPYLGVRYITIDENLQAKRHLPVSYGALVTLETPHDRGVVPGSPADRAGLREGDIILECNGKKISVNRPVQDILENLAVNDKLRLLVLRGKRRFSATVTLAERR